MKNPSLRKTWLFPEKGEGMEGGREREGEGGRGREGGREKRDRKREEGRGGGRETDRERVVEMRGCVHICKNTYLWFSWFGRFLKKSQKPFLCF